MNAYTTQTLIWLKHAIDLNQYDLRLYTLWIYKRLKCYDLSTTQDSLQLKDILTQIYMIQTIHTLNTWTTQIWMIQASSQLKHVDAFNSYDSSTYTT